ncbi:MAG: sulfite exporter TauE/SafE family protein [Candidatus Kryptoniota bacterium]
MSIFDVYLPVAGIHFNILLLVLIGFCVGVLGGFFGVGGGWMITPALNIFGFHMAFAIGTPLANIFGQSIGAVRKHHKMGNIDWKLGLLSIISSVVGVEIGSRLIITLEKIGDVGIVVRWCYVILLSTLGVYMLYDYFVLHPSLLKQNNGDHISAGRTRISEVLLKINIPPMISLPASGIESVSLWVILIVFLLTGFISGFMGVGGGFIILPVLVYLVGLPTTIAVGTSLVTVLFTAGYGCFTYGLKGRVELIAAFIMLIGASVGAQIGATAIKFIRGYGIRLLFAIMVILASLSVLAEQFYKMAGKPAMQTFAGIVLMGTAFIMTFIIIGKIIIESRKEMK